MSESDVCRRQNLTSKFDPGVVRVNSDLKHNGQNEGKLFSNVAA